MCCCRYVPLARGPGGAAPSTPGASRSGSGPGRCEITATTRPGAAAGRTGGLGVPCNWETIPNSGEESLKGLCIALLAGEHAFSGVSRFDQMERDPVHVSPARSRTRSTKATLDCCFFCSVYRGNQYQHHAAGNHAAEKYLADGTNPQRDGPRQNQTRYRQRPPFATNF